MRVYFQFIIIFLLSVSSSCSNTAQTTGSVSPDEFEKAVQQKNVQILDTRTAGEFQSGHISGALQADWTDEKQFIDRTSHLDKNRPVYVYCLSGARSSDAAEYLRALFHHQEKRKGYWPWPGHSVRNHQAEQWINRGRQQAGQRNGFQNLSTGH